MENLDGFTFRVQSRCMGKADLVRREIERLKGLIDDLKRDWSRLRWAGLLLPVTLIVVFAAGPQVAVFYFLFVGGFWATAYYLIAVRQREYHGEIAELQVNLAQLEGGSSKR
ncbi:MAG: hypothetical protein ACI9KE_003094 [Polyangiales bacterium]|jgi:hypothetical protein